MTFMCSFTAGTTLRKIYDFPIYSEKLWFLDFNHKFKDIENKTVGTFFKKIYNMFNNYLFENIFIQNEG